MVSDATLEPGARPRHVGCLLHARPPVRLCCVVGGGCGGLVVVVELVVEAVELLHARPAVGCCCPARCASFHVPPPHCSLLTAH